MDIRPYAFAALAINASIFVLVRLRHSSSVWSAALFAFVAASIVYFQFLFAVALPALALCFFSRKISDRKAYWRQICVARKPRCVDCSLEKLCNSSDKTWSSH